MVRNIPASAGNLRDASSIPGSGRSGGGHGNSLKYSCLENPMDGGAWWAAVHGGAKSWTRLKRLSSSSSRASQWALVVKNMPASAGDLRDASSIPESGRSGGGHGNSLKYSCLENSMDRRAWQAAVRRVAESDMTEAT